MIRPLFDRVLIERTEEPSQTASGLFLPETAKERPVQGTVVAIGPGKKLDSGERAPMNVKKGDVVVYSRYAGNEVEIKGAEHLIMRESELLGVLEG